MLSAFMASHSQRWLMGDSWISWSAITGAPWAAWVRQATKAR